MSEFESRRADWLTYDEALEAIFSLAPPLAPQPISLAAAMGGALATPVLAPRTLPPGPTSAMDGYAVHGADIEEGAGEMVELHLVGECRPGDPPPPPLKRGTALRVMTGALVPPGTDSVIPVEGTAGEEGNQVRIAEDVELLRHIRPAGEEMQEGDLLAEEGSSVTPFLTALLAAAGVDSLQVVQRPKVALLVTGDELDEVGGSLHPFRKVDVFSPSFPALVEDAGGAPLPPERVGDDPEKLRSAFEVAATRADLIITTGGASMGVGDQVKRVLDEMGYTPAFWRSRVRPGSPVGAGTLHLPGSSRKVPVVGLPGNPVSAFVTFLVLARPAIRRMGGHRRLHLPRLRATLTAALKGPSHLTHFFRVRLSPVEGGRWEASSTGFQGSGMTRSISDADGLAVLPEGIGSLYAGAEVEVILFPLPGWLR